ncbi:MAG TPA: tetratricopeptide repeat protein [Pyrinomonadaceae bacterium]|nr:tetratricopeptide repeat protein [Pyrinomonadaceae bacterium]
MRAVSHYCQKCLAANPLGQELCGRCGTRLMLVVEPPAARFEEGGLAATHEEHLLERISALENRLMRMTDKLEQTLDLLLRQAKNAYFDHALIDTLITVLAETNVLDAARLNKLWRERCQKDTAEQEAAARREKLRHKVLAAYKGADAAAFEREVQEGFGLLALKQPAQGVRKLERAAALHPANAPLHAFLGEHFFEAGKSTLALDYLERAVASDPRNEKAHLLLGLVCGDAGQAARAKKLLRDSVRRAGATFAAHYGLGRLLAAEGKWSEALKEFKRAAAASPSAEAHYVLGCVNHQLGRDRMAARHLRKAIEEDRFYAEVFYVLGLVLWRVGKTEEARAAFEVVRAADLKEPRYRSSARRILRTGEVPQGFRLFGPEDGETKQLITGGDKRLAAALRREALAAFEDEGPPPPSAAR